MALITWQDFPTPARYVPGEAAEVVTHQGFGLKRAAPLTRWVALKLTVIWSGLDHEQRMHLASMVAQMRHLETAASVPWGFYQKRHGGLSFTATPSTASSYTAGAVNLNATGWSGVSPYLRRSDMIGFEIDIGGVPVTRVHWLRDSVTSTDSNLNIWPPLREDMPSGSPIYFMPSTVGGADGRFQPSARPQNASPGNVATYLENTMKIEDPSSVAVEAHPSNIDDGHFGIGGSITFVDAVETAY